MRTGQTVHSLGLVALLAGCTSPNVPDTRPADFHVLYEWTEGSLPPPHHYEYTITIKPGGHGEVVMVPDYAASRPPTWTETFAPTPAELDNLYRLLREQGVFTRPWRAQHNPPVGGSSQTVTVTAHGRRVVMPAFVLADQATAAEQVDKAVRAMVPQALWDKLEAQRQQYVEEHQK
jgi:hypothetical protein